ncbi:MAG: 4-hydroxy-3-methylbut-2-enyl diphosphate reductase, partial [Iodobacter sp.]
HLEVKRLSEQGFDIIMIGHKGHPEVEGTMGQAAGGMYLVEEAADVATLVVTSNKLAYVTQTTLSVDDAQTVISALRSRFPDIVGPKKDDICYATQNRQDAVKQLVKEVDVMVVVGSPNSSNSNRLREVAANLGIDSYMVDNASELKAQWFVAKKSIGVTAGASAPDILVRQVIAEIESFGAGSIHQMDGIEENVIFSLPKGLV